MNLRQSSAPFWPWKDFSEARGNEIAVPAGAVGELINHDRRLSVAGYVRQVVQPRVSKVSSAQLLAQKGGILTAGSKCFGTHDKGLLTSRSALQPRLNHLRQSNTVGDLRGH